MFSRAVSTSQSVMSLFAQNNPSHLSSSMVFKALRHPVLYFVFPNGDDVPVINSCHPISLGDSLVAQLVKNPPAIWETWVRSLDWEDPLEKGMATHSSILAWRIPWTVWSIGSQRIGHDRATFTSLSSHFLRCEAQEVACSRSVICGLPHPCLLSFSCSVMSVSDCLQPHGL